jgi:diguanylate cyclase (GGDEF) domain
MKKSLNLRTLFALNFAIIIIILIIIISTVISNRTTTEYKKEIGNSLSEISYQMSDKLDRYMWSRYEEIYLLSKLDELSRMENKTKIRSLLEELKKNAPEYAWIGMLDSQGNVVTSTGGILEGDNISSRPVYKQALKEPFIGDVHEAVLLSKLLPNPTGEAMKFVDISIPINNQNGNLEGILAAHLSWEWAKEVEESIMKPLENRNNLDMFIVSKDNTVLLGPDEMIGEKLNLNSINNAKNEENNWNIETWNDGKKYLTGYSPESGYRNYKGLGWTIVVRQPIDIAYAPIQKLINFIILIGIVLAGAFALIGWVTAGVIAKPLQKIVLTANQLRLGDKVEIPKYHGIEDIEILSVSLRSLLSSLINTENALGEMEMIAHHDQLTGLPNRVALRIYLEKMKARISKEKVVYTIYYLDLDGFKSINDGYGHDAGDSILRGVANRISDNTKEGEVAVRIGGDEFVIIKKMEPENFIEYGSVFANNLIRQISEDYIVKDRKMNIGCSVGGAFFPLQGDDPMEIVKMADQYMYESKRNGKNRYTFYYEK